MSDRETARGQLAAVWADQMPITGALGITIATLDDDALVLALPLPPNRNHKGTVFAGSLAALATLAGWSTLWLVTRAAGVSAHVVIQDSSIRYLLPVRSDAIARCRFPDVESRTRLLATVARRGRARLALEVEVADTAGQRVATFAGRYVVHR
jgi:thioesterase domain-containing protein